MSNQGFDRMYVPETDTELQGPTRWPPGSIAHSSMHLNFHGRALRRSLGLQRGFFGKFAVTYVLAVSGLSFIL